MHPRYVFASIVTVCSGLLLLGCPKKGASGADAAADAAATAEDAAVDPNAAADAAAEAGTTTTKWVPKDAGAGPRGECTTGASSSSVPIPNADKVLAGLRPRFRAAFIDGLKQDATLGGTLSFSAKVAADGSVTSVEAKGPGLNPVIAPMKSIIQGTKFDAPSKPSILNGTVDCRAAK